MRPIADVRKWDRRSELATRNPRDRLMMPMPNRPRLPPLFSLFHLDSLEPLESNTAVKTEDPGMHTQSSDDSDPYAADARALTEAQRVLSVARSTPQIPITSAEVAENQANALRAEISALKQSLAQERVHIDDLRAVADTAIKEMKSTLQKMQTLNEMHKREIMEKMNASQRSMAEEYELLMIKQQFLALEWDRGGLDDRISIAQNLHQMIQLVQTSPFPVAAETAVLVPAGPKLTIPADPMKHARTESDPPPTPTKEHPQNASERRVPRPPIRNSQRSPTASDPTLLQLSRHARRKLHSRPTPIPSLAQDFSSLLASTSHVHSDTRPKRSALGAHRTNLFAICSRFHGPPSPG
ncbi:hypothetical protein B0H13DRAFT_2661753 [Mycena leptocephala]|nr:hypothetical protein B0H13DRAFT_2661753 [Mycena leptocephala]